MPTLNCIGKDAVVNHHKEVQFRLLKPIDKLSVGENSGNLLVQSEPYPLMKVRKVTVTFLAPAAVPGGDCYV